MPRNKFQPKNVFRGAFAKAFFVSQIIKEENSALLAVFSHDNGVRLKAEIELMRKNHLPFVEASSDAEAVSLYVLENRKNEAKFVVDLYNALGFDHKQYYTQRELLDQHLETAVEEINGISLPISGLERVDYIDHHKSQSTESHYFAIGYGGKEQTIRISNHMPREQLVGYHHIILVQDPSNAVSDFKNTIKIILNNPPLQDNQRIESVYREIHNLMIGELTESKFKSTRDRIRERASNAYIGSKAEKDIAEKLFEFGQSKKMEPMYYERLLSELTGTEISLIQDKIHYREINMMLSELVSLGSLDRLSEKVGTGKLFIEHNGKKLKKSFNGLINYLVMVNGLLFRSRQKAMIENMDQLYSHKREIVGMLWSVVKELKGSSKYNTEPWMRALFAEERGSNILVGFREGEHERIIVKSSFGTQRNIQDFKGLYDGSTKNGIYTGGVRRKTALSKYAQEVHEYYLYLKNRHRKSYDYLS